MSLAALDRPVWNMLTGPQAALAQGSNLARRIDPAYGPFAAMRDASAEAQTAFAELALPGEQLWLVEAEEWPAPPGMRLVRAGELTQMVAHAPMAVQPGDAEAVLLGEPDAAAMAEIALATEPGPWRELTRRYGQFYGLRRAGRLAAMAGERMRPAAGLVELSAVCTWPEYRGQGLAAQLIRRVMAGFSARGDVPFLHSFSANTKANALYETLGFTARRTMVATMLVKD